MIRDLLIDSGLNKTEAVILMSLLETGPSIASIVSKRTRIKRPTVYAALDGLVTMGLVLKRKEDQVTYYSSVSSNLIPKILSNRAKIELNEVIDKSEVLEMHLSNFSNINFVESTGFKVERISSIEALYAELENAIYGGSFDAIFNPQSVKDKYLEKLVLNYFDFTAETEVRIREILVNGPKSKWYKSKITNPNHKLKFVSQDSAFESDIILLDGSVLMSNYSKEREVGIKITDAFFFNTMKTVFQMLWDSLD